MTKNNKLAKEIVPNIYGIYLSDSEYSKLKVFLMYELEDNISLFDSQISIYSFMGQHFNSENLYIIVPYTSNNVEKLNIVAYKPKEVIDNLK